MERSKNKHIINFRKNPKLTITKIVYVLFYVHAICLQLYN
jgi:hypothetical protein